MRNSKENTGVVILADLGFIYTVKTLVTELNMKHKVGILVFITFLSTGLLAGCGMSATEKLEDSAKEDSALDSKKIVANIISNPGDVISSENVSATSEVVSCENSVETKILVSSEESGSEVEGNEFLLKGGVISTEVNNPIKLSLTTLEPLRVELPGSQYTLVHTQRGVNIYCLTYSTLGEYKVSAEDKTLLTVEVVKMGR